MYNFNKVIPVKLGNELEALKVDVPDGKYLKSASVSLVKYGSSNCDIHVHCQLGNTGKEKSNVAIIFGKCKRAKSTECEEKVLGKVFAFDAVGLNIHKFGFVYLVEEKSNVVEVEEKEETTED